MGNFTSNWILFDSMCCVVGQVTRGGLVFHVLCVCFVAGELCVGCVVGVLCVCCVLDVLCCVCVVF